ncbi:MAG: DNA polymerase II [Treponema sp.]|jgi:DNA polymerase-2|nr:DNA polymerase II [Treponema sp.]
MEPPAVSPAAERTEPVFGFIVHSYADMKKNRLYLLGRLEDGRSFAAVEETWRPYFHIYEKDRAQVLSLLRTCEFEEKAALYKPFPCRRSAVRGNLIRIEFNNYRGRSLAAAALLKSDIQSPDADIKPAELFLGDRQIRGSVSLKGDFQSGKRVDVVIRNAEIFPGSRPAALRIASVDIETDAASNSIRAVSVAWADTVNNNIFFDENNTANNTARVLLPFDSPAPCSPFVHFHNDEKSMLSAFNEDIRAADPDVITGWNFLDFDFPCLAGRFKELGLPFTLGRSDDNAVFLPGSDDGKSRRRRSAAAVVPGRQVLDALRVTRAAPAGMQNRTAGQGFSLDETAWQVLGEGKTVHEKGEEKIAALDCLYAENPALFGEYCLRDAQLALKILSKTGLFRLTAERSSLTGVSLDKAWTSVASFERVYGIELRKRGIAPPAPADRDVSGAAGGTVLESEAGLFNNVAVFDFRSLYPTIMRTFNIDPLSHELASRGRGAEKNAIVAPNGAVFSREPGVLPALIEEYFSKRKEALESGDGTAAHVYKILMNSFYGVLGTSACRYGKSSLAGAITSFARKWLFFSRDWFNSRGFRVLYGDTDSLFVVSGLTDAPLAEFKKFGSHLADEINLLIAGAVKKEYGLESFIELRFDKAYRRFLIPPVRHFNAGESSHDLTEKLAAARGRAKGYGGYLLHPDGSLTVDVKGMEAVRSDSTPLARRLQLELLEQVFRGCAEDEFRQRVEQAVSELRSGSLDDELVYRKRLTRYPETYTSSTPPQVKAARALGWKKRRGVVEYLWTVNGPEPASLPHGRPDYDHYADSQIFPLVRSIAAAARWDVSCFSTRNSINSQIELKFN